MNRIFATYFIAIILFNNLFAQVRINESFTDPESIFDWTIINRDNGIQTWQRTTLKFRTAPASVTSRFESATLQNDDWLISKRLFVNSGDSLSFWHSIQSSAFPESLVVKIGSTNNPNNAGWTNLAVIFATSTSWQYKKYSLSAFVGQQIYIAFVNRSRDAFNIYIDDITGPQIIRPNYDLALVSFYQYTGLPIQSFTASFSYEKKKYEKINEPKEGFRESQINNTKYYFDSTPENIELNRIYVRAVTKNLGLLGTNYNFGWNVSGVTQPTAMGNFIPAQQRDSITLIYSPPSRGTYLVNGSISVGGDDYPLNNSSKFRMLVYPNSFTRTIYDRGDNFVDSWMGFGNPFVRFKAGMRYTAEQDIKLAGVDFLYQTEFATVGDVEVQVRAAGPNNNIPGPVIYNKLFNSSVYLTQSSDYVHFAFDNNAPIISAGSDYWITIKLPLGIKYPCAVHNDEFVSGRSYYQGISDTTMWFPLIIQSAERCWIMRSVNIPYPSSFPFTQIIYNGWNLVSVPGYHPNNQYVNTWWQYRDKTANVHGFNVQYQFVTDLEVGKGYWMKHQNNRIYNTGDEWPSSGILYYPNVPIQCNAGWNLFGVYQSSIPVSSVTSDPSNLISSNFYGFTPGNGYQTVSVLNPGYGYWVKLSSSGKINLNSLTFNHTEEKIFKPNPEWIKITLTDAEGKNSTLYLTKSDESTDFFELPPLPFPDIFDVRFSSQKYVENSGGEKIILFQGVVYPVKFKVEKAEIILSTLDKSTEQIIKAGDEFTINDNSVNKIKIRLNNLPSNFQLEQNYPNPFNPSTTISWRSPINGWHSIKLFDVLGREIKTIVDSFYEAGYHTILFNADSELPSGIYFYKLTIGSYSEIKKMIFTK
ncbi:choice-of-anchor J domain-containing protein [Ignavibacterium sp.]|uniref:T9SS-dependent choice-of-anchor J family protein n=1 Tax=Ignavibacterium sp. TaxID=2651167 RepID=UPI00307FB109